MKKEAKKSFLIEQHETKNDKKKTFLKSVSKNPKLSLCPARPTPAQNLHLVKTLNTKKLIFFLVKNQNCYKDFFF